MIRNDRLLRKFYNDHHKIKGPPQFSYALKIFTSMWKEGVALGVLPPEDPMDGIETDIKMARVLHSCSKHSCQK